jgi:hypothetical protein
MAWPSEASVDPVTTPLRRMLNEQVAERRRADAAALSRVPDGVFNHLRRSSFILFSTTGRTSGLRREKFWGVFAPWGDTIYNIEEIGERAQWVRNALANPRIEVRERVGAPVLLATARVVTDPDEEVLARTLVMQRERGDWSVQGGRGLVVAFDAVL